MQTVNHKNYEATIRMSWIEWPGFDEVLDSLPLERRRSLIGDNRALFLDIWGKADMCFCFDEGHRQGHRQYNRPSDYSIYVWVVHRHDETFVICCNSYSTRVGLVIPIDGIEWEKYLNEFFPLAGQKEFIHWLMDEMDSYAIH